MDLWGGHPWFNGVIFGDRYDGQFLPTSYETAEGRDVVLATAELFSRQSGCTRVNTITCLHGSYPDDLSWEMEACFMGVLVVFVQWFWYNPA